MIISPPFIFDVQEEPEEDFLARTMVNEQGSEGCFPISHFANWHGGVHLAAPGDPQGGYAPVRAMADGVVAFVRQSTVNATQTPVDHPLKYRNTWTDDGCVVIRHETTIGADAHGTETTVVFFSIYMHLAAVYTTVRQGDRVYRKQGLGIAGSIYGVENQIHLEIICDDTNLERIIGRSRTETQISRTRTGRIDAAFGTIWYLLPQGTMFYPDPPQIAPIHTSTEPLVVGLTFRDGACIAETRRVDGRSVSAPAPTPLPGGPMLPAPPTELTVADYEYDLQRKALADYPQSQSAGYELLRFGRVLGPDSLQPPNASHAHKVISPGGEGWVELNAPNVRQYSDADFPDWAGGWRLIDGQGSTDSRCASAGDAVIAALELVLDPKTPRIGIKAALADSAQYARLTHKICKFRSEWENSDLDARYGWLKTDPDVQMSSQNFERHKAHVTALSFWQQANLGIDAVHWHIHPRLFIELFRKCGWLSLDELCQLLPRVPHPPRIARNDISWIEAGNRFRAYQIPLNRMMRKYNILSAKRQTIFLPQTYTEIGLWSVDPTREIGEGRSRAYDAFYGRGIMQLTWPENFAAYGAFRTLANIAANVPYADQQQRITATSSHLWGPSGKRRVWFPRYDPEVVADDHHAACDSGGFFWVSKWTSKGTRWNINKIADRPFNPVSSIGRTSELVNGGGNGFEERERWSYYVNRYRGDSVDDQASETFSMSYAFTVAKGKTVTRNYSVTVDYTAQRP